MPTHLKRKSPVAKKAHTCNFCGCQIAPGTSYWRDTLLYDGTVYDWLSHKECNAVADKLDMYDDCDDCGLGPDWFSECLDSYVQSHFRDKETDDLPAEISSLDQFGQVKLVLETWDRPDIVLRRKKSSLANMKMHANWGRNKELYQKRIAELDAEISELENKIEHENRD